MTLGTGVSSRVLLLPAPHRQPPSTHAPDVARIAAVGSRFDTRTIPVGRPVPAGAVVGEIPASPVVGAAVGRVMR